eukprot:2953009-Pleurochrysis_carterae.AAC.1
MIILRGLRRAGEVARRAHERQGDESGLYMRAPGRGRGRLACAARRRAAPRACSRFRPPTRPQPRHARCARAKGRLSRERATCRRPTRVRVPVGARALVCMSTHAQRSRRRRRRRWCASACVRMAKIAH